MFLILADDLTGANDTAIQFVKQGLSALVVTGSPAASVALDGYDVISVTTNSRGMSGGEAYQAVSRALKQMNAGRTNYTVYKKVDSVLRGNPGRELAAVMDALNVPLAIAAPSFPANRAALEKGMLYGGGNAGSGGIDAVMVFADGTGRKTENIPLEEIRRGAGAAADFINARSDKGTLVFVADAVTDGDLETVYRASARLRKPAVMAGSAGLALQIAKDAGRARAGLELPLPLSPALVIAGTRRGETAAQIAALSRVAAVPVIRFRVALAAENKAEQAIAEAYAAAAEQMSAQAGLCIVAVDSMFEAAGGAAAKYAEGDDAGAAISDALGVLAGKLCNGFNFSAIISTGGDTSLGICRSLGINGIEPLAEICPGIPLGRIAGGAYSGRYIITKSGRFGNPDSLAEIARYIGIAR
jgi:uncharacterized protein YgbK (DUF1537 family)